MPVTKQSTVDTAAARRVWEAYEGQHDVSGRQGQTAGIEPVSGRVWIGASIKSVVQQRDADGCDAPLYFIRIGSPTYYRKGAHQ